MTKEELNKHVTNLLVRKCLILEELEKVNKELELGRFGQNIMTNATVATESTEL